MQVAVVDYHAKSAPAEFTQSLKETGFAVVANHPIAEEFVNAIYAEWQQFFNSDEKHQYLFNKEKQDGYFPFRSENAKHTPIKDLKEFFHYYPWGRSPAGLSLRTQELYLELSILAAELLQWIEENTPNDIRQQFSMPLREMIKDSDKTLLRILHYPPLQGGEEEGAVRAAEHEDINLITLLPAATHTGLEVKDSYGQWHEVTADHGTLVVNTGDMLQMCSNGYYKSTSHRVVNPIGEAAKLPRLSMPLFLHPHDDVRLSAEHTASSYLQQRLRELGLI
jgi:isopenicillin N synthase-like dioxygenase